MFLPIECAAPKLICDNCFLYQTRASASKGARLSKSSFDRTPHCLAKLIPQFQVCSAHVVSLTARIVDTKSFGGQYPKNCTKQPSAIKTKVACFCTLHINNFNPIQHLLNNFKIQFYRLRRNFKFSFIFIFMLSFRSYFNFNKVIFILITFSRKRFMKRNFAISSVSLIIISGMKHFLTVHQAPISAEQDRSSPPAPLPFYKWWWIVWD